MLTMPREVVNIAKTSDLNCVRSAEAKLQIARNSMTDVYTDTEYSVTMLAVLAGHRGFVIRKMLLKFGTGGLKMPNDIANNMADTIHQLEKELKDLREENKVLTRDCLRLIKSNDKLRKKLKQIAEYKRLLKAAIEDIESTDNCCLCKYHHNPDHICQTVDDCFTWRYTDEALKLLNDEK